jgi:hypothetical protein
MFLWYSLISFVHIARYLEDEKEKKFETDATLSLTKREIREILYAIKIFLSLEKSFDGGGLKFFRGGGGEGVFGKSNTRKIVHSHTSEKYTLKKLTLRGSIKFTSIFTKFSQRIECFRPHRPR